MRYANNSWFLSVRSVRSVVSPRLCFDLEKGILLEMGLPVLDEEYNINMIFEADF